MTSWYDSGLGPACTPTQLSAGNASEQAPIVAQALLTSRNAVDRTAAAVEPPVGLVNRFDGAYWSELLAAKSGGLEPAAGAPAETVSPARPRQPPTWLAMTPGHLDGTLVGDQGVDPACLVALARPYTTRWDLSALASRQVREDMLLAMPEEEVQINLAWMREAEVKVCANTVTGPSTLLPRAQPRALLPSHECAPLLTVARASPCVPSMYTVDWQHGRLAMLAAVGWPLAELLNPSLGRGPVGRVPALLNGGLADVLPFLLVVACASAYVELGVVGRVADNRASWRARAPGYVEGDLGFDPMGIFNTDGKWGDTESRKRWHTSEILNGRLAMLAVSGFVAQEYLYTTPVVTQTPVFFGPLAW